MPTCIYKNYKWRKSVIKFTARKSCLHFFPCAKETKKKKKQIKFLYFDNKKKMKEKKIAVVMKYFS